MRCPSSRCNGKNGSFLGRIILSDKLISIRDVCVVILGNILGNIMAGQQKRGP